MPDCNKCEIEKKIKQRTDIKSNNPRLTSRLVFDKINQLGKKKKEEKDTGGDCVSRLVAKGVSNDEAMKLCKAIQKRKEKAGIVQQGCGSKKSKVMQNSFISENESYSGMTSEELLTEYETTFRTMTQLKYKPFSNMAQYDSINERIQNLDSKLWDLKYAYGRNSNDKYKDDTLLQVRMKVRKEMQNETITVE